MYNEIFQALMVEGDVLISKPLLDVAFDIVKRCKSPTSKQFLQIPNLCKLKEAKPEMYGGWGKCCHARCPAEWWRCEQYIALYYCTAAPQLR
jgi:hypothetical protein